MAGKEVWGIYLIGLAILVGAITVNIAANSLGLIGWYEAIQRSNFTKIGILNQIYLTIIYPSLLGLIAFFSYRFIFG